MIKTKQKITTGTKEYADSNVNCYFGCSNNCKFCYAKKMAIRFGRKTEENWKEMVLNEKALNKGYRKRKGRIMFPSSHDITVESFLDCVTVLKKLLRAGNEVLIVTKPNPRIVLNLILELSEFKKQIQFRFTITSNYDPLLTFWEENAPNFKERLLALKIAHRKGFKTSISLEPFLDKDPIPLIKTLAPYVTGSIWIGKMNYIKANNVNPEEKKFYDYQRKISSWSNIKKIISNLQKLPEDIKSKIKLKDTIKNLCEKKGMEVISNLEFKIK